jgi:hypothetical protein
MSERKDFIEMNRECWNRRTDIHVASAGLEITLFEEYDHSPYPLAGMAERSPGEYVLGDRMGQRLPHAYALRARKR